MSVTTTMENRLYLNYFKNVRLNMFLEKALVEKYFDWIKVKIIDNTIQGSGTLIVNGKAYQISLVYDPRYTRFDRIYIKGILYHPKIHMYGDNSLCLYHPIIDRSPFRILPLVTIIPWISEWCIHYEEWKKYGVWLGKEIQH